MEVRTESDEEFARRLQAQELGLRSLPADYNQQTPLIRGNTENPTVINARLNELSSARATVAAIFIVHFPQVSFLLWRI
jgi:anti-sigma-K factor RskA